MEKITGASPDEKSEVLDLIVSSMQNSATKKLCILFGAGVSISGGIRSAKDIVRQIRKDPDFAASIKGLDKNAIYPELMESLSATERRKIINSQIENAKINWAHLALAELLAKHATDRLMTVNFDPLLLRAAGLIGTLPAVYDLSLTTEFNPSGINYPAVFYLHGQHTSFVQLHTTEQVTDIKRNIDPVITDCIKDRTVLVIGYSGECDPVFETLGRLPSFNDRLFWVGYKENDPPRHVQDCILNKDGAHWVRGFDADEFLVQLAAKLKYFPPEFLKAPFTFLKQRLSEIADFPLGSSDGVTNPITPILPLIDQAIETEGNASAPAKPATQNWETLLMLGKYDEIIDAITDAPHPLTDANKNSAAWALLLKGNELFEFGARKEGDDAEKLFKDACVKYEAALRIKPDMHEALNNWGATLSHLAQRKDGDEAERLFKDACDKYEAALKIKPDMHEALINWGNALSQLAQRKDGAEAESLFKDAQEKYRMAENIQQGSALYNLACLHALRGEMDPARQCLTDSARLGIRWPGADHIRKDPDLAGLQGQGWLEDLLQAYPTPKRKIGAM